MTDPESPDPEPALDPSPSDPSAPGTREPSSRDPMTALLKRSLAGDPSAQSPGLLPSVQRRLRQRSRGKFFADGWSTTDARVSHILIACAMLLLMVLAYFALGPIGIQ